MHTLNRGSSPQPGSQVRETIGPRAQAPKYTLSVNFEKIITKGQNNAVLPVGAAPVTARQVSAPRVLLAYTARAAWQENIHLLVQGHKCSG